MRIYYFYIIFIMLYSCTSPREKTNAENINKVLQGMRIEKVYEIMGEPELIRILPDQSDVYMLRYGSPSGSSDWYWIYISRTDSLVVGINYGI